MPFQQLVDDSIEIQTFLNLSVTIAVKSDMTKMLRDRETKGLLAKY